MEQWAEIRRLRFVKGLSQREIRRGTGLHHDTIRKAINSSEPPVYRRAPSGSKLDPLLTEPDAPLVDRLVDRMVEARIDEIALATTAGVDGPRALTNSPPPCGTDTT